MRVWLDNWEWQCCGEQFGVGSEVEWGLTPISPGERSFLLEPLGAEVVDEISHCETHHEDSADDVQPVPARGRVESITAVYWARAPRLGGDPREYHPVAGTAVLERRETADGWEPQAEGGPCFEGYLVELTPLD